MDENIINGKNIGGRPIETIMLNIDTFNVIFSSV